MDNKWKKVFSSDHEHKVIIVREVLFDNGIPSVILDKKDSSYKIGKIELLVNQKDVLSSLQLIKKLIRFE